MRNMPIQKGARWSSNDAETARHCGVTGMTIKRWSKDPKLGFPKAKVVNGRNFRSLDEVDE
jgi:hypothetical protein